MIHACSCFPAFCFLFVFVLFLCSTGVDVLPASAFSAGHRPRPQRGGGLLQHARHGQGPPARPLGGGRLAPVRAPQPQGHHADWHCASVSEQHDCSVRIAIIINVRVNLTYPHLYLSYILSSEKRPYPPSHARWPSTPRAPRPRSTSPSSTHAQDAKTTPSRSWRPSWRVCRPS
jgi:hypothetical protein